MHENVSGAIQSICASSCRGVCTFPGTARGWSGIYQPHLWMGLYGFCLTPFSKRIYQRLYTPFSKEYILFSKKYTNLPGYPHYFHGYSSPPKATCSEITTDSMLGHSFAEYSGKSKGVCRGCASAQPCVQPWTQISINFDQQHLKEIPGFLDKEKNHRDLWTRT